MNIHDSISYKSARLDLVKYVSSPKRILDIGCNTGNTGLYLKQKFGPELVVYGIDYNSDAIIESKQKLDIAEVVNLNKLEDFKQFLKNKQFDYIFIADVLEHIIHPIEIVEIAFSHLELNGHILISLPNSSFYPSFFHLLTQKWPRNPRGIYDKTHLTIYLRRNLPELTPKSGKFQILQRKYRWRESKGTKFDFLLKIFNYIPYFRDFFTFQYLISIEKTS